MRSHCNDMPFCIWEDDIVARCARWLFSKPPVVVRAPAGPNKRQESGSSVNRLHQVYLHMVGHYGDNNCPTMVTITVPTTTATTSSTTATPTEQWVGDKASEPQMSTKAARLSRE